MIARLLITSSIDRLRNEITKTLALHLKDDSIKHPDLLFIRSGEKIGIIEAKKIKEFFSFKPFVAKGRVVVLEDASILTLEAQNALLKTIEELPREAVLIMGTNSNANLLPTVVSRCEIINLEAQGTSKQEDPSKHIKDLEKILNCPIKERFGYIENLKDKEEFLRFLVYAFRETLLHSKSSACKEIKDFLDELLQAEKWTKQNVNIRAILEYLMLVMPSKI